MSERSFIAEKFGENSRRTPFLEVCCADAESLRAAKKGGAQRVELCASIDCDGLTPDDELVAEAQRLDIWHHALIRLRDGHFVYTPDEVNAMADSIRHLATMHVDGVVIGALKTDGSIDMEACRIMVEAAHGIPNITFHRAFDCCCDPFVALEQIIELGCNRLLTSGQAPTAAEGRELIRQLVERAGDRLVVMPGSGVSPQNAADILGYTGAHEIHGTLRSLINGRKVTTEMNVRQTVNSLLTITDKQ